jgi:membrane protease subunit (stomatin/prohibitin family)
MRSIVSALVALMLAGCARITGVNDLEIIKQTDAGTGQTDAGGDASASPTCAVSDQGKCGQCIQQNCCTEAVACTEKAACKACLDSPMNCASPPPELDAYETCAAVKCTAECP